jgi:hypothetical protein
MNFAVLLGLLALAGAVAAADTVSAASAAGATSAASQPPSGAGQIPPTLDELTIRAGGIGLLLVIAISGFFGGLVDGLRSDRQYKARLGGKTWEWGSVGDGLVGTAAALAIFAFAENVFASGPLRVDMPVMAFIKIVAWGVLSGYAGTRLLDPLSAKVVKQLATDAARAEVRDQVSKDDASVESLREAAQAVTQHLERLSRRATDASDADDKDIAAPLDIAQRKYELLLKADPASTAARIGLANVHCYRAEHMQKAGKSDERDKAFSAAIKEADNLIKRDSQVAKAYYNRACYKALRAKFTSKPADPDAVADLLRAVELDEHLKDYAKGDDDLIALRGDTKLPFLKAKESTAS